MWMHFILRNIKEVEDTNILQLSKQLSGLMDQPNKVSGEAIGYTKEN